MNFFKSVLIAFIIAVCLVFPLSNSDTSDIGVGTVDIKNKNLKKTFMKGGKTVAKTAGTATIGSSIFAGIYALINWLGGSDDSSTPLSVSVQIPQSTSESVSTTSYITIALEAFITIFIVLIGIRVFFKLRNRRPRGNRNQPVPTPRENIPLHPITTLMQQQPTAPPYEE